MSKPIGVIGAGSFGKAIANVLSINQEVLLYVRRKEQIEILKSLQVNEPKVLRPQISFTNELPEIAEKCDVIFPIVPSSNFRSMMQDLAPFLHPYHMLIHGTKGLDVSQELQDGDLKKLKRNDISTMSEVIRSESVVLRVGCLAGPNLAAEMAVNLPAATVIASEFEEVRKMGEKLLRCPQFKVYGNSDLIGVELSGVLKNIIAIASGVSVGLGFGDNAKGLLLSRGLAEMVRLGTAMGTTQSPYLGLAGIGDLITTCSSKLSRNFRVGFHLANGRELSEIIEELGEVAEGVKTVRYMNAIRQTLNVRAPITEHLHKMLFEGTTATDALAQLMALEYSNDADFMQ